MAERENITNPTMGSNDVGTEKSVHDKGMPAGTDTQTRLAALSSENESRKNKDVNNAGIDSEETFFEDEVVSDDLSGDESEFPDEDETDE